VKTICYTTLLLAGLSLLLVACASQSSYILPTTHPRLFELGERREFCTKCHGFKKEPIDFERYNHTATFTDSHRLVAYQDEGVCALCHNQGFCSDCHATHVELKPSLKSQTENYRRVQHRGDYLSRHRIEGRIDPTSCFRCHGNPKSAQTCQSCHG
jgi:hypothetical protein